MKRAGLFLICSIITVLMSRPSAAFTIEFPPDESISTQKTISVIIRYTIGEIDTIRVLSQNQKLLKTASTPEAVNHHCLHLDLVYGLNKLKIQGLRNGSIVSSKTIQVYLKGRLRNDTEKPPARFVSAIFHSPDNEKSCIACHDMEATIQDIAPQAPESSSCYTCHAPLNKGVQIHYPSQKWYCLFCHQADGRPGKYSLLEVEQNVCHTCHGGQLKEWPNQPVIHGPVAKGQCSLCHAPHSSGHPSLLRLHATDLCIKCHADKATGAHVISGFYGKGHPVRGLRDPLKTGREFSCASCHDPHAGKNRNLLRHNRDNLTEYCLLCHRL